MKLYFFVGLDQLTVFILYVLLLNFQRVLSVIDHDVSTCNFNNFAEVLYLLLAERLEVAVGRIEESFAVLIDFKVLSPYNSFQWSLWRLLWLFGDEVVLNFWERIYFNGFSFLDEGGCIVFMNLGGRLEVEIQPGVVDDIAQTIYIVLLHLLVENVL